MSRLLTANFARLVRSKIFYVMEIFMIGYSLCLYLDTYYSYVVEPSRHLSGARTVENWNLFFFNEILAIGVILAIFITFYIGVEYSDGTIRNKITAGHSRRSIYLANLITCYTAGIVACATYSVASLILGLVLMGRETVERLWKPGQGIVVLLFIVLAYTALFVGIAMTDSNKTRVGVISLLFSFIILAGGMVVCMRLEMREEGENLGFYEKMEIVLPAAQALYVVDDTKEYSVKQPLGMFAVAAVSTGIGVWVFKRQDIK